MVCHQQPGVRQMSKASRAAKRAAKNMQPIADGEVAEANASASPAPAMESTTTEIVSEPKQKPVRYAKKTWGPTDVITLLKPLAKGPDGKSKSSNRFNLYFSGMTVQEYTDAVVKNGLGNKTLASNDLRWDTAPTRNFISIAKA